MRTADRKVNVRVNSYDRSYDEPYFFWNSREHCHLHTRIDAHCFHLFGHAREDATYILDAFSIVRRQGRTASGHSRTRAIVLAYLDSFSDADAEQAGWANGWV